MTERMWTGYQALQLLALGPCIFVVLFLCLTARHPRQALVPAVFFISLAASFCLPLLNVFSAGEHMKAVLLMMEAMTPAMIFLLVIQLVSGNVPALPFWAILAVPLLGGGTLVYGSLNNDSEACVLGGICLRPQEFKQLYDVFGAALTLLLTIMTFHRIERAAHHLPRIQQTMNALVFALVLLNSVLLALKLMDMAEIVTHERALLATSVVRIGFIYLVLTLVFRVFDRSVEIDFDRVPTLAPAKPTDKEQILSEKVRQLMTERHLYRTMDIGREKLARELAVTEQVLSRAVNLCLGQSISTLINHYRVEEARQRLAGEQTAITVIAFEVGFNSIPSFNRVFKQATGLSPSAYRSAHAGKQG